MDDQGIPDTYPTEAPAGTDAPGFSMDDLYQMGVDEAQQQQISKDLLPEAGKYASTPPWTATPKLVEKRPIIRVGGRAESPEHGAQGMGFGVSPVARKNDEDKWDMPTRLWNQAVKIAKKYGTFDGSIKSVLDTLTNEPIGLRGIRTEGNEKYPDPGFLVVSIFPLKQ